MSINDFIKALQQCHPVPLENGRYMYNGIDVKCSAEGYQLYLDNLYNDALGELPTDEMKLKLLKKRLQETAQMQSYFDLPTPEVFEGMERDMVGNRNISLRNEYNDLKEIVKMADLQKLYCKKLYEYVQYLLSTNDEDTPAYNEQLGIADTTENDVPQTTPQQYSENVRNGYAFGYEGIMEAFGWGRTKVAEVLRDEKYSAAIERDGRKIAVNIEKMHELLRVSNKEKGKQKRR